MAQPISFYTEQAAICGAAAEEAQLTNQRDKYLQAQAAWQALADTATKTQAESAKRDAARQAAQLT